MQASPDDIDLASLWAAIMRNRWRLLLSSLLAGAATYGVLSTMRPQYTSQATLIIEAPDSDYARARGSEQRPVETRVDDIEVASQVEVVRASDALMKIAAEKQLEKNAEINTVLEPPGILALIGIGDQSRMTQNERILANLNSRLSVYQLAKTRLIAIDFQSRDPQFAADIANAIAQSYLTRSRAAGLRDAVDATESLGAKIDEVRAASEAAQLELEKFRAESGLIAGQNNVTLLTQQLSELNTQRTQVDTLVGEAVARARLVRQMLADGAIEAAPEVLRSANMQQLFQQQIRIERDIAELTSTLLPAHPRMRQLRGELATVRTRIQEEGRKVARSLDNEAEVARARQAAIAASIDELKKRQAELSASQARLGVLEREAQSKRETYQTILDRLNDASTRRDSLSAPAKARLNAPATVSSVPVFPKKTAFSLLAMVGTLLTGLAIVITRELIVGARSGTRRLVQRDVMAPMLSERSPTNGARPMAVPVAPLGAATSEGVLRVGSLAELTALLLRRAGNGSGYRALVTSGPDAIDLPHYGIEIARFLAARGKRVVLIDWSAQSVGVSDRLKLVPVPGLRELAGRSATFEDVVQIDPKSPVHVITAGAVSALPDGDAADRQLGLVLDALDEIYDFVVAMAPDASARQLFERVDGRFDAAISVRNGPAASTVKPGLLGYAIPTLTEIVLYPSAAGARARSQSDLRPVN